MCVFFSCRLGKEPKRYKMPDFLFHQISKLFLFLQVVALKKSIRQLEQKVQDQEEELDDQAGQIQMLEQVATEISM